MKTHDDNFLYSPIIGNFLSVFIGVTIMATSTYVNGEHGWINGHGPMIIGIFVSTVLVTFLHAYRESIRIELKNEAIDHKQRFEIRLLVAAVASIAIHMLAELQTSGLIRAGFGTLYIGGTFLLVFDYMLNYQRNKPLFYVSTAKNASGLDRLMAKIKSPVTILALKIVVFLLTLAAYNKSFSF